MYTELSIENLSHSPPKRNLPPRVMQRKPQTERNKVLGGMLEMGVFCVMYHSPSHRRNNHLHSLPQEGKIVSF